MYDISRNCCFQNMYILIVVQYCSSARWPSSIALVLLLSLFSSITSSSIVCALRCMHTPLFAPLLRPTIVLLNRTVTPCSSSYRVAEQNRSGVCLLHVQPSNQCVFEPLRVSYSFNYCVAEPLRVSCSSNYCVTETVSCLSFIQ